MNDLVTQERGPASMSLASAADIGFGAGGVDLTPQTLGEVVGFAKLMSTAQHAIPGHLRENAGACMAVTLQALSWRMSPFAIAQKSYKVNDQIAYEAQVIAAVINSRANFKIRPIIAFSGEGPTRQCTVTFTFTNGDVREYTSPEVGKITTKNSPLWKSDVDQQLSYFSLRSAARRHCPEVILGVLDRDEVEHAEPMPDRSAGTGMVERLTARAVDVDAAGFNVRGITAETEAAAPKRRGRPPKAESAPPQEPETIAEIEDTDDVEHRPIETASALSAEAEQGSLASATGALIDILEEELSRLTIGQPCAEDVIAEGYPEADEAYHLNGDEWAEDSGYRDTYKNGVPHGEALESAGLAIYEDHAPEAIKAPELAPSDFPPEFNDYIDAVEKATTWNDGLTAMQVFYKTDAFKGMTAAQQNKIRAQTWQTFSDDGTRMTNLPDPAQNASAFRLFTEATEDADAIEGCLRVLENETGFIAKGEDFKNAIRSAATARQAVLRSM